MAKQLVYTSVPRGLWPGTSGYCTVVSSEGITRELAAMLESLSVYRFSDGNTKNKNGDFSHVRVKQAGDSFSVLVRTCDAGLDYSNRRRRLSHFLVLSQQDHTEAGPAWLVAQEGVFLGDWGGQPTLLKEEKSLPSGCLSPQHCATWEQLAGDPGYAGLLAEAVIQGPTRTVVIVCPERSDPVALAREATSLLPPDLRWDATFASRFISVPPSVQCQWRFIPTNSPVLSAISSHSGVELIDLTRPLPRLDDSPGVTAARQGRSLELELPSQQVVVRRPQVASDARESATTVSEPFAATGFEGSDSEKSVDLWDNEPAGISQPASAQPIAVIDSPSVPPPPRSAPPPPPLAAPSGTSNLPLLLGAGSAVLALFVIVPLIVLAFLGGDKEETGGRQELASKSQQTERSDHTVADGASRSNKTTQGTSKREVLPRNNIGRQQDLPTKHVDGPKGGKPEPPYDGQANGDDGNEPPDRPGKNDNGSKPENPGSGKQNSGDKPQTSKGNGNTPMPIDPGNQNPDARGPKPKKDPVPGDPLKVGADQFLAGLIMSVGDVNFIQLPPVEGHQGAQNAKPLSNPINPLDQELILKLFIKSVSGDVVMSEPQDDDRGRRWSIAVSGTSIAHLRHNDGQLSFYWDEELSENQRLAAWQRLALSTVSVHINDRGQQPMAKEQGVQLFRPVSLNKKLIDVVELFRETADAEVPLEFKGDAEAERMKEWLQGMNWQASRLVIEPSPVEYLWRLNNTNEFFKRDVERRLLPRVHARWQLEKWDKLQLQLLHIPKTEIASNFSLDGELPNGKFQISWLPLHIKQLEDRLADLSRNDAPPPRIKRLERLRDFHVELQKRLNDGGARCDLATQLVVNFEGGKIVLATPID